MALESTFLWWCNAFSKLSPPYYIAELGVRGMEPCEVIDIIDGYTLGGHGCEDQHLKGEYNMNVLTINYIARAG